MPTTPVRGVEISWWRDGTGPDVLCLHETGTSGEVWRPLGQAAGGAVRLLAPDRRGWDRSDAPQPYAATTVEEQAEDAAALAAGLIEAPAICVGAGVGALACLQLMLTRGDVCRGAVLVEPPLLAFSVAATEQLSEDRRRLIDEVAGRGPHAAVELAEAGALPGLLPGSARIASLLGPSRARPMSLLAELGAPASWELPLRALRSNRLPAVTVVADDTPPLLREAADGLTGVLGAGSLVAVPGPGPAHARSPADLAEVVLDLAGA